MKKGYLANGLFSLGDRMVNELLGKKIRESVVIDLYIPQENMAINDKQGYADSGKIYEGDYEYLKQTDVLVTVIDGCEIDSGTSAEIGIISTMGKKIYALYTDTRQQGTENKKKINALIFSTYLAGTLVTVLKETKSKCVILYLVQAIKIWKCFAVNNEKNSRKLPRLCVNM